MDTTKTSTAADFRFPASYELIESRELPDLQLTGHLLRHRQTGARVLVMPCGDPNKVFSIGFRTPPADSTGVAHIIEHTVLCGSERFPLRDPFKLLVKGSLKTFLNAMTYPDRTVYPVASCNDQDFRNLMHVYLDAVFYPNIYREQNIFRQEGWHYEIAPDTGALTVNGVVYNEMKGALSSPDDVLGREIFATLFPHTPYAVESGGDPEVIPDLTYEAYLDFHRRYYHPSNSFIVLYGDMDVEERLQFMDSEYLSRFDRLQIDSTIPVEPPFKEMAVAERRYSILEDEDEKGKSYLALNICLGQDTLDEKTAVALQILEYVLGGAEGAPLKKALRERGIGEDVITSFDTSLRQPVFSVVSQNTDPERKEEFLEVIRSVLTEAADRGLDRGAIAAGISYYEFRFREANYGTTPKGLIYGLAALETWLYHEEDPWRGLNIVRYYSELREDAENGYFEELIRKYLLDVPHSSLLVLRPEKGLADRKDAELRARLDRIAASFTEEDLARIRDEEAALRKWQGTPDSPEAIASIPSLKRSQLKREAQYPVNRLCEENGVRVLAHEIFTNGIIYLRFLFNMESLPERLYRYVPILRTLLGALDTEAYSYEKLDQEVHIRTGGISAGTDTMVNPVWKRGYTSAFILSVKAFSGNLEDMLQLVQEIALRTRFTDAARICEVLEEERAGQKYMFMSAGHNTAAIKALGSFREETVLSDLLTGQKAYKDLDELCGRILSEDTEVREPALRELSAGLEETCRCLFRAENLLTDCTASSEDLARVMAAMPAWTGALHTEEVETGLFRPSVTGEREAFITPGQVQYVCRAGSFESPDRPYTGALRVLRVHLGYNYLWPQIREKGGAYGCMSGFGKTGTAYMVSYRDPHLRRTVETFEKAGDFIRRTQLDEEELTRLIIGAVSDLDQPMTPSLLGAYSMYAWLRGESAESIQKERDEILDCTEEDIRRLGDYLDAAMETGACSVVGAEAKIRECSGMFDSIEKLF